MGFLSGILDAASHAVGPTLNLMAGRAQGQAIAQERQQQQLMQAYALQRQQQQDALARTLAQSTMQSRTDMAKHYANQDQAANARNALDTQHEQYLESQPKAPILGTPEYLAAQDALEKVRAKYRPAPQPTNVYLTGIDPATGKSVIYAAPNKGAPSLTNMNVEKPVGGAGGSQSLSPEDRAKMLMQAKLDNATMKAYENKVMQAGQAPGTVAGLAGAAAASGGVGFGQQALGIIGNKATGIIDPDYQRYIIAQRSYGRIMGNLQSKRYTDHQAEIERSISGLQGNDLDETIAYKQQLRDASIDDPAIQPSTAAHGAPTAKTQKAASAPRSSIAAKYGITPTVP